MPVQTDEYRVLHITSLGKSNDKEARELLDRVAKQVQPIMRKRQWTVHKLSEFIPRNPNLLGLNVNGGAEVKIRLRPAGRPDSFYDWNHVLGTMLHELVHNRIGPHNADFYKLLDELWAEAEELMDKGVGGSGQGFDAQSAGRLGSHSFIPQHNPPEHKMADAVRKAAEARAKKQCIMPQGPCKLGGRQDYRHLTPAQAAAAAAERRARDNQWCPAEHSPEEVEQEVGAGNGTSNRSSSSAGSVGAAAAAPNRQQPAKQGQAGAAAATRPQAAGSAGRAAEKPAAGAIAAAAAAARQAALQAQQQGQEQRYVQQQQQQHSALQQEWQLHLQRQQQQRQSRKRAADTIDLTISDSEDDDAGPAAAVPHDPSAAAAAGAGSTANDDADGDLDPSCPCCSAAFPGSTDAAAAAAATPGASSSFRLWCARHRQLQQQQQGQQTSQQRQQQTQAGSLFRTGTWVCSVCTLVNRGLALQCEVCLSARNNQH